MTREFYLTHEPIEYGSESGYSEIDFELYKKYIYDIFDNVTLLKATIEAQEIIIKDKTAIMEAMAQPKTCDSCEYMEEVDENGWGICSNRKSWLSFGDVPSHGTCKDYEPKVQP